MFHRKPALKKETLTTVSTAPTMKTDDVRGSLDEHTPIEAFVRLHGLMPEEAISRAETVTVETGERFESVITRLGMISELTLAQAFCQHQQLKLIRADAMPANAVKNEHASVAFLREMRALPLSINGETLSVAVANPFDDFTTEALGYAFGKTVTLAVGLPSDIEAAIDRLYGASDTIAGTLNASADDDDLERLRDVVSDAPVIRAVNRLIADAVDARASDIHVEPAEDRVIIRLRIDGILVEAPALPASMRTALVSRIKVMADLNIAERRLPQDGRMRVTVRGNEIDLRVATSPSIHGETVVMRILDRTNLALDFATLGFDTDLADKLRIVLARPYGIVLVTGPTGSGKTTTLYAALSEMNTGTRKILTVEDPIEYRLPGIVQTQVNSAIGLTFASALRSFLRQDPDIMMVGEIRDLETAQIAVQSALTGHIILSTLHTNTAAGAVTRLLDMNVEPFLLTSTLNAVLAQRLVRRLCPKCRVAYQPSAAQCLSLGLVATQLLTFYNAKGCPSCQNRGYSGRIALLELLIVDEDVASMILKRADTREIVNAAKANALSSMLDDGVAKLKAGDTTIEELLRVVAEGS